MTFRFSGFKTIRSRLTFGLAVVALVLAVIAAAVYRASDHMAHVVSHQRDVHGTFDRILGVAYDVFLQGGLDLNVAFAARFDSERANNSLASAAEALSRSRESLAALEAPRFERLTAQAPVLESQRLGNGTEAPRSRQIGVRFRGRSGGEFRRPSRGRVDPHRPPPVGDFRRGFPIDRPDRRGGSDHRRPDGGGRAFCGVGSGTFARVLPIREGGRG